MLFNFLQCLGPYVLRNESPIFKPVPTFRKVLLFQPLKQQEFFAGSPFKIINQVIQLP